MKFRRGVGGRKGEDERERERKQSDSERDSAREIVCALGYMGRREKETEKHEMRGRG